MFDVSDTNNLIHIRIIANNEVRLQQHSQYNAGYNMCMGDGTQSGLALFHQTKYSFSEHAILINVISDVTQTIESNEKHCVVVLSHS